MPSKKVRKKSKAKAVKAKANVKKTVKRKTVKKPAKEKLDTLKLPTDIPNTKGSKEVSEQTSIRTVFDAQPVEDPLTGEPAEVQAELDELALYLQKHPNDQVAFHRIVAYMHKYLLGLVFKKYAFVRGYQESDIYQEALIALFKKAVPSFKTGKGMSFLNFAKLCVNRHLITILHASKHRRKDLPINTAISLDHNPSCSQEDDDGSCPFSNVVADQQDQEMPYEDLCRNEAFDATLGALSDRLSDFEKKVLREYLQEKSYREAATNIRKKFGGTWDEKSIDNALLRIRNKAASLREELGETAEEVIPLV